MRTIRYFILFTFISFIFSCSQDDQHDISDQHDIETAIEKRQSVIGNWTPRPCVDITIFIDPNCDANWINSLGPSIDAYNDVPGASINMERVMDLPADIVINCEDFNGTWANNVALGEWPDVNGEVGGQVFLNTDFDNECNDICWFQATMMHELGHNLGFTHGAQENATGLNVGSWTYDPVTGGFTNDTPLVTLPGSHIVGTPNGNGDSGSIFNGGADPCGSPNCTFSPFDIKAMQSVYSDPCNNCLAAIEDPCDCPEAFPDDVEVTCYCVCFQGLGNKETITEVPCGTEVCVNKPSFWPCRIITECERILDEPTCSDGIMNGDEEGIDCGGSDCDPCESDPVCYCDCKIGGVSTSFIIDCNLDCNTNGFGTCVKRWE